METICPQEKCTACSACMNACPKDAIEMREQGACGYAYPVVNQALCIDCGLCQRVCPALRPVELHSPLKALAGICRDAAALAASASGGAASAMGRAVVEAGGVVYGCQMGSYTDIRHHRYTSVEEMERMRGSKYVQSSIGLIYRSVKADLDAGLEVLFTGTACQVGGLRNYLRKDYPRLLCIDLVCHGVPSQKLLRDDVGSMFRRHGLEPTGREPVHFRRICSGQTSNLDLRFGTFVESAIPLRSQRFLHNHYITAFMAGLTFRENCYACPYARPERTADVTVADFWGYGGRAISTGQGVSLLMPATGRGMQLIERVRPYMQLEERPVREAVRGNGQLQHPSARPAGRDAFLQAYAAVGVEAYGPLLKGYVRSMRVLRVKQAVYPLLRRLPGARPLAAWLRRRLRR